VLSPFFPGGIGVRHRAYVVSILGEALGGPKRYRGDMVGAHRGLGISDAHFDRAAAHLGAALVELGIPRHLTGRIIAIVAGLRHVAGLRPAVMGVV
jgi:truncated hemoglobin YjbI